MTVAESSRNGRVSSPSRRNTNPTSPTAASLLYCIAPHSVGFRPERWHGTFAPTSAAATVPATGTLRQYPQADPITGTLVPGVLPTQRAAPQSTAVRLFQPDQVSDAEDGREAFPVFLHLSTSLFFYSALSKVSADSHRDAASSAFSACWQLAYPYVAQPYHCSLKMTFPTLCSVEHSMRSKEVLQNYQFIIFLVD